MRLIKREILGAGKRMLLVFAILTLSACVERIPAPAVDPLPSWNEAAAKQTILNFVKEVTDASAASYVPPEERVAVFDNDGTLWAEKPAYFQFAFMVQQVKNLAGQHPEWQKTQPFKAVLENDSKYLEHISLPEIFELAKATHAGMTQDEFEERAKNFLATARHPTLNRLYTACIYQPMLELLEHLRKNDFKVFICSGGGIDFIRQFSEEVYGIPRENVIGTALISEFRMADGRPELLRTAEFARPINDKEGKPVNIQRFIGRKPILAFGNSDGDIQMLQFAGSAERPYLSLLLHHNDAEREFSYSKGTEKALELAKEEGWRVVYIKEDFKVVFPFESGE